MCDPNAAQDSWAALEALSTSSDMLSICSAGCWNLLSNYHIHFSCLHCTAGVAAREAGTVPAAVDYAFHRELLGPLEQWLLAHEVAQVGLVCTRPQKILWHAFAHETCLRRNCGACVLLSMVLVAETAITPQQPCIVPLATDMGHSNVFLKDLTWLQDWVASTVSCQSLASLVSLHQSLVQAALIALWAAMKCVVQSTCCGCTCFTSCAYAMRMWHV